MEGGRSWRECMDCLEWFWVIISRGLTPELEWRSDWWRIYTCTGMHGDWMCHSWAILSTCMCKTEWLETYFIDGGCCSAVVKVSAIHAVCLDRWIEIRVLSALQINRTTTIIRNRILSIIQLNSSWLRRRLVGLNAKILTILMTAMCNHNSLTGCLISCYYVHAFFIRCLTVDELTVGRIGGLCHCVV